MSFGIQLFLASVAPHKDDPIRKMMINSDGTLKNTGKTLITDPANIDAVSVDLLLVSHDV